jgi:hypothetical protein
MDILGNRETGVVLAEFCGLDLDSELSGVIWSLEIALEQ